MGRPRVYANPSERVAAWKRANPERHRKHTRESVARWRRRNPEKVAAQREIERLGYGLTSVELDDMRLAAAGACTICGKKYGNRNLYIDHDHATGRVRGLLCRECNLGLAMFTDSPEKLRAAAVYLERVSV